MHSTPSTTHFGLQRAREYSLIWRDVKLEVGGSVPGQPVKVILRGVSGAALPGELVALVGPSGDSHPTLHPSTTPKPTWVCFWSSLRHC